MSLTAHQTDIAIAASIAISALTLLFLAFYSLTRPSRESDDLITCSDPELTKAGLAIDADFENFGEVRPASIDMLRNALRKAEAA